MKITYLGHATLYIQTGKHNLLVDPFITGNEQAAGKVAIADLNPDFILLTHAHQDHVLDVEAIAKQSGALIISNYEIVSYYQNKGLQGHPMNHGGAREFEFGWLKYINAVHTSSFADGTYGGQPGGFLLKCDGKMLYIAGDTALHADMKLIPLYGTPDLAVLPIGDNFTMGVEDALHAAGFVGCDRVMGVHYNTFGYIVIDTDQALRTFQEGRKTLLLPDIGEEVTV
jgi:L-ascorbate metabolism protein UlaG (beta-lactamase superfamily)